MSPLSHVSINFAGASQAFAAPVEPLFVDSVGALSGGLHHVCTG